jgi:hypothetical protein
MRDTHPAAFKKRVAKKRRTKGELKPAQLLYDSGRTNDEPAILLADNNSDHENDG